MITKAVVPVAGWSTRFLPAVKSYAKHLVPVLDKPQIQLVLEELVGAGITDICLVHRPGEETIKNYFSPDPKLDAYLESTGKTDRIQSLRDLLQKINRLEFLPQTEDLPYGNGTPAIVAKHFIGSDPFVYLWGDDLTIEPIAGTFLKKMITTFETLNPAVVLAVQQVPHSEIVKYGSVKYDTASLIPHKVAQIIEKPSLDEAPSDFGQGGRFVVSPKIIEVLEKQQISKGELWFTEAENTLAQSLLVVTENYLENGAFWNTTGDPLNWLKVNIMLATADPRFSSDIKSFLASLKLP